jgi:long-chain acyl-CoA synthetase
VLEGYGLSEISPVATFNRSVEQRKIGSIGLPIWETEAVVHENRNVTPPGSEGELILRRYNLMKG